MSPLQIDRPAARNAIGTTGVTSRWPSTLIAKHLRPSPQARQRAAVSTVLRAQTKDQAMSRIVSSSAVAAFAFATGFASLPAAAQDANWQISQALIRPGVLGPGVAGIAPDGQVIPGGDMEAQNTGPDGNTSMRLILVRPYVMSGGSGAESAGSSQSPSLRPYYLAVPFDPSGVPGQR
jgi:hypothetical protein